MNSVTRKCLVLYITLDFFYNICFHIPQFFEECPSSLAKGDALRYYYSEVAPLAGEDVDYQEIFINHIFPFSPNHNIMHTYRIINHA